ncbi:uncharacterized protein DUF2272 [Humitalea rosea]|uniref:Uncharacterized protein DUF2272 n=1 Tax=Humitalea rosea TaxID=990373 RepID=A0A2W7IJX7_9PROT|nr:DUF2272 domain-containing protein [Humitalea rosea]PZW47012.1 uncharacterized protein DUF2272 [Humitalea rosea]
MLRPLCLLLLLAGCAVPVAPPPPPLPYPPSVRLRLLDIALGEWREWGAMEADDSHPTPPPRGEALAENFPRLVAYWRSVPDDEGAVAQNRTIYARDPANPPGGLWAEPAWSAAFISYLMVRAGVDRREFPPDASHVAYLDALTATAAAWPAQAPFLPVSPLVAVPVPGDLVCVDRSRVPLTDWSQRQGELRQFRPTHCDLVVSSGPGAVEAIGGNVGDAVLRTRYGTDGLGRLLPRRPGRAPWLVVMRNRLGLLPPFGGEVSARVFTDPSGYARPIARPSG